ncbi:MAG: histidine phosphatase family protein [Faecalibacterium sp.]|nr:histidine phosphatase family protein [Ruminococcus sp.]MCM1391161.1 histidine phosphatase family protein [Ruminococcus sp.]MCM1486125.1 histidine phosphatase family protein [Faecalibacterium sp.]
MKTYQLHIIRHGLTAGNLEGLYIGHTDVPLCEDGIAQIEEMKRDMIYPQSQFVFSGPLKRCTQTSQLIYPDVKPIIIQELTEYDFGEFDGKNAAELHEKQPLFDRWLAGEPGIKPPFGESNIEFTERICSCFVKIVDGILKTGTDNAAVITHGGVIMTLLANFALPEAEAHEWMTPSGCGYTLRITPSLWMAGKKLEVIEEIPMMAEKDEGNYYDGWDYYPDPYDDDFDVSEYIN